MRRNAIGQFIVGLASAAIVTFATAAAGAQSAATATSSLPPAVLKAFQQAYPAAAISASAQERDNGRVAYRIDSVDKGRRRVAVYDANGSMVRVAEQVSEQELPAPVAAAMRSHPRAIYGSGMKVTRNGAVQYELTLRGTRKTAMIVKPDGTVLSFK